MDEKHRVVKNKQIGKRFEATVVQKAREHGLDANRVPLSGSTKTRTDYTNDVVIRVPDTDFEKRGECKKTKNKESINIARKTLQLLDNEADFIAFALNMTPVYVILPFEKYIEYVKLEEELIQNEQK